MSTNRAARTWFTPTHGAISWLWLSLFVILLDQVTKAMISSTMNLYDRIELLPVLELTRLHNTGAAFSMLADATGWQRWFFIGLGLIVSIVLMLWMRRLKPDQTILAIGLALVLGGALGNVIDRVWLGHVIDFIHVHWHSRYFPAFNVADSAITAGAGCLLLDAFRESERGKK